ncbi:hypothetical protein EJA70_02990 [Pseudomonas sp. PB103]|uniref:hypothetical protein n=1 Tax=Pseudomonas sp. PB103 TaxID=2494698 RepID=UPI00131EB44F|nr:hypothetical protein [Pseudomonas sp. PB103]KAE9648043.1 hypothetical protein EJA70_02990 [Pseudomonas sp. PB103]
MSELKVIYLGPACQEQGQSSGREWCQDDVWDACECGHESVRYVLGSEFDRVKAERDGLQLSLTTADQTIDDLQAAIARRNQRIDELVSAVRSINHAKHHEVLLPGDDEPQYPQRKEWVDWILGLCSAPPTSTNPQP